MISFCIGFLIFCVAIGSLVSVVIFVIDIIKWHKKEERVKIVPGVQKLPDELLKESEVKKDAPRDNNGNRGDNSNTSPDNSANAGQSNTSAIFDSWL